MQKFVNGKLCNEIVEIGLLFSPKNDWYVETLIVLFVSVIQFLVRMSNMVGQSVEVLAISWIRGIVHTVKDKIRYTIYLVNLLKRPSEIFCQWLYIFDAIVKIYYQINMVGTLNNRFYCKKVYRFPLKLAKVHPFEGTRLKIENQFSISTKSTFWQSKNRQSMK